MMKKIVDAIKQLWKFRWIFLLNVYLISPLLLYDSGLFVEHVTIRKSFFLSLPASVLLLIFVQSLGRRLWVTHLFLFPFYLIVGVDLYLIFFYKIRLTSSSIPILLGNLQDAGSFIENNLSSIMGIAFAILSFYGLCLYLIHNLVIKRSWKLILVSLLGIIGLYGAAVTHQYRVEGSFPDAVMNVVSHDRNSPFSVFPQGYMAYSIHKDARDQQRHAASFVFNANRNEADNAPEIFILVIGESSRPDHWGLYGYHRDTTPLLATEPNLIVFRDALTQTALTQLSVPFILTRRKVDEPDVAMSEKSIISVYKEVGFLTYWLSTQQVDHFTGLISRYSNEADIKFFYEQQYDMALIKAVKNFVNAPENESKKHFFVLHTQGSHFTFSDRFPKDFAFFSKDNAKSSGINRLINDYDDTIRYTDYTLFELISFLKSRPEVSGLLYASDHGENLRDDKRSLFGHFFNNEYDIPIPLFIWFSDQYMNKYPGKVAAAKANQTRHVNTRAVFYTMADMANISISGQQILTSSLLSPGFIEIPRLVLRQGKILDFDEWLHKEGLRPRSGNVIKNNE